MKKLLNVGIVGAGLMGNKRANAIEAVGGGKVVAVADVNKERALEFAKLHKCEMADSWQELVKRKDIDVVIIAVFNKFITPIAVKALQNKKHILCEKPLGRNSKDSLAILKASVKNHRLVKVGFNHRFQPALWKAKQLFDQGAIGKLLFIRARYGHGGRLGMEKERRFDKNISGGGELLDQGVHIIDLCRWFAGDFNEAYGVCETKFWNTNFEDNAFVILKNKNVTVSFHVSTTNWKNIFSFEIFGDKGFLNIDGKGGSYGKETLVFGRRPPQFGVPQIEVFEFLGDTSWQDEWINFVSAITKNKKIIGDAKDGLEANRIVETIYKSSKEGKPVNL